MLCKNSKHEQKNYTVKVQLNTGMLLVKAKLKVQ